MPKQKAQQGPQEHRRALAGLVVQNAACRRCRSALRARRGLGGGRGAADLQCSSIDERPLLAASDAERQPIGGQPPPQAPGRCCVEAAPASATGDGGVRCFSAPRHRGTARAPAAHSLQGSAALDRLVLDASAAAMRGDMLEGLRRALKALGRTRLVGAGPTMASFDGSVGDVVAGDLCPRAGGVARGRGRGSGAVTFGSLRGRGARGVLPVLGGATLRGDGVVANGVADGAIVKY